VRDHQTADKKFYPEIKNSSRENRKNPTEAEETLWKYLKNEQTGYKIRRKHIIDVYIADFVCLEKKVVIEVDGKYHDDNPDYDNARTEMLQVKGFSVIRFTNEEVIKDPAKVQQLIKKYLDEAASRVGKVLPPGEDSGGASSVDSYPLETTTMPGWAGSSWYYLRYMDAHNEKEFASREAINYWQNVDLYIGGSEHATGHLLYVRFWTKFLNDLGYIPVTEPAKKLINQGMIQGVSLWLIEFGCYEIEDEKIVQGASRYFFISTDFIETNISFIFKGKKYIRGQHSLLKRIDIHYADDKGRLYEDKFKVLINDSRFFESGTNVEFDEKVIWLHDENGKKYIKLMSEVEKMSKSKYNVVTPDDIVLDFGADCLRLYEMFLGPLEQSKPWNTNGISGVSNFIRKFWRLFHLTPALSKGEGGKNESAPLPSGEGQGGAGGASFFVSNDPPTKPELKTLHKTIKKVTEDIERYSFNTSVSNFMICVNELTDLKCNKREILEPLTILISPYAPHIAEEIWEKLGHKESITYAEFPVCNEEYLVEDSFEYPVSINGKTRFKIPLSLQLTKEQIEKEVLSAEELKKYLDGNAPKKIIVVPGRIVNVVI
jgi:leucyl-tRNA synthetase/very-short-patch-repair endonuclease